MSANFPVFSLDNPDELVLHLQQLGWVALDEEVLGLERAGEGNMNLVVRVLTTARTFIVKQSRPWVEKYPSIAAPEDRLLVEAAFYELVSRFDRVSSAMPRLLATDEESRLAMLEDLGTASDCTDVYGMSRVDTAPLIAWLYVLHDLGVPEEFEERLRNREMRSLNHAHIFDLPMTGDHGMNLDDVTAGLQAVAQAYREGDELQEKVRELGEVYLEDGRSLLHGDFYPGSWLRTDDGIKVIDPEFAFLGPPEFDLGVLAAHLLFAGYQVSETEAVIETYDRPIDQGLVWAFSGTELMRRLLGVAQLPLQRSLDEKKALLDLSRMLILRWSS